MFDDGPQGLRHVEFINIHFELEFQETVLLSPGTFLKLRRELRKMVQLFDSPRDQEALSALFEPPVPTDPLARKRVQRSGPGFVIRGLPLTQRAFDVGDSFDLTVLFFGKAINYLSDFVVLLQNLGLSGLSRGQGAFEIASIAAEESSGEKQLLWVSGDDLKDLAPPVLDARWWVERADFAMTSALELYFVTPGRLLSGGRPLFRPTFRDIFPFILRRVTSAALAHCGLELVEEPQALIASADRVQESANGLRWTDWRRLEGESRSQDLGGITGSLRLEGPTLQEIFWILRLGSLLQLGKGAAYGAGRYDLQITS